MNEVKTMKVHCLSQAISPITHNASTSGNESIINRTKVFGGGQIYDVPVLSGNAIRHKMVREPGAAFIAKTCGLEGKLTIDQANYLFYGGSLSDSAISDNLSKIAAMQQLLPLYRLIGGSLKNQIIAGSLLVSMGYLVCEETREILQKMLPQELIQGLPELRTCEDFVSNHQYTRGDASKHPELLAEGEEAADKSNLMIYSGQNVIAGAMFYHSFILQSVSRLEVGALTAAIKDWQYEGGIIGGTSRIGHGKLYIGLYPEGNNFFDDAIDLAAYEKEYREYTKNNADKIVDWLNDAFPATKKETKKKANPAGFFDEVAE